MRATTSRSSYVSPGWGRAVVSGAGWAGEPSHLSPTRPSSAVRMRRVEVVWGCGCDGSRSSGGADATGRRSGEGELEADVAEAAVLPPGALTVTATAHAPVGHGSSRWAHLLRAGLLSGPHRPPPRWRTVWARTALSTRHGRLDVSWRVEDGSLVVDTQVPAGRSAGGDSPPGARSPPGRVRRRPAGHRAGAGPQDTAVLSGSGNSGTVVAGGELAGPADDLGVPEAVEGEGGLDRRPHCGRGAAGRGTAARPARGAPSHRRHLCQRPARPGPAAAPHQAGMRVRSCGASSGRRRPGRSG